ncbi:MAG: hypothetical protein ACM3SM_07470 [Bacteroidota bacterium]
MKNLFGKNLVVLFLLLSSAVLAQQDETLINGKIESGGYGGPVVKFSQINNEFAVLVGGYGGWLIDHQFMIGGGGFGMASNIKADPSVQQAYGRGRTLNLEFGYGGLMLEYISNSRALVHYSVSALIGAGGAVYHERSSYDDNEEILADDDHLPSDGFFVFEPTVNAEMNVTSFFRIAAGASYRYVSGLQLTGLKASDLSSPSVNLTFKFGKF